MDDIALLCSHKSIWALQQRFETVSDIQQPECQSQCRHLNTCMVILASGITGHNRLVAPCYLSGVQDALADLSCVNLSKKCQGLTARLVWEGGPHPAPC